MTEIRIESHESFNVHWYSVNVVNGKKDINAWEENFSQDAYVIYEQKNVRSAAPRSGR